MSRTEQLYESYEDALFALLMDKVAKAEGARLLEENERLQNDPNAAVPEHIDKACMDTSAGRLNSKRGNGEHIVSASF